MINAINGWTKEEMLEVIKSRKGTGRAVDPAGVECVYLAEDGNKCAVGLFIPNGHPGQTFMGHYYCLIKKYPELKIKMPLAHMRRLQAVHDSCIRGSATDALVAWVEKNVE